jgi:hypothetical protein
MYSQKEKDGMAMKNSTIDKFAARQGCPDGQVPDGKGGCVSKKITNLPEITVKPSQSQVKSYTSKTNAEADRLNNESNLIGMVNYSTNDATTKKIMHPPTKRLTEEIKKGNDRLDYGNPMDKPNLSTIKASKANLEKAKKINAREKRNYNSRVKTYTDKGWSKDEFFDFGN